MSRQAATASPTPRLASTVVLLRDADPKPEILMVKRHAKSAFGAVYVFPGGVVESCDARTHDCCGLLSDDAASALLGTSDALDYYSAAAREVFEETGVLLAQQNPSGALHADMSAIINDANRRRLNSGALQWDSFLHEHALTLASHLMHYFAYWVTPAGEPKRFSTRFFLAEMPAGQQASHDGTELTDSCWMTAADVLDAQRSGAMRLIYPTYRTLKDIAGLKTVNEVVNWAIERQRSGVARVLPAIIDVDGNDKVVLPGDPRYPEEDLA
jgi:8-oxo-dGTP pyrophosphatase MutT (NUDIX family)